MGWAVSQRRRSCRLPLDNETDPKLGCAWRRRHGPILLSRGNWALEPFKLPLNGCTAVADSRCVSLGETTDRGQV